jgi:hypothetical protein
LGEELPVESKRFLAVRLHLGLLVVGLSKLLLVLGGLLLTFLFYGHKFISWL